MIWRIVLHLLINRTIADNHQMNFPVHAPVKFICSGYCLLPAFFRNAPAADGKDKGIFRNIPVPPGLRPEAPVLNRIGNSGENLPVCQAMLPERRDIAFPHINPGVRAQQVFRNIGIKILHQLIHAVHGNNVPE